MTHRILDLLGYLLVALLFLTALTVAARTEVVLNTEKPSQFIWQAPDGTYTNLPATHAQVKQVPLDDSRITPVKRTATPHDWAAAVEDTERSWADRDCRDVYLGSPARGGAATVCRGDGPVIVEEQRVRRRGSIVTTTDTVLSQDGRELIRIRGRSAEHDPSRTRIE